LRLDFEGQKDAGIAGAARRDLHGSGKIIGTAIGIAGLAYCSWPDEQVIQAMTGMGISRTLAEWLWRDVCLAEQRNTSRPGAAGPSKNTTPTTFETLWRKCFCRRLRQALARETATLRNAVLLPTAGLPASGIIAESWAGSLLITGASQLLTLRGLRSAKGQFPFQLRDHRRWRAAGARWRDRAVERARRSRRCRRRARGEIEPGGRVALPGFVDRIPT